MTAPSREPTGQSEPSEQIAAVTSWDDIDRLVNEVTAAARNCDAPARFHKFLIGKLVEFTGAIGGGIWECHADGTLHLICQSPASSFLDLQNFDARHGELLKDVLASGRFARWSFTDSRQETRTSLTFLVCPVLEDADPCALIELIESPAANPHRSRATQQLAEAMAELAGDFHRRFKLRELSRWRAEQNLLDEFLEAIHRGLDLDAVCYAIANEGRRFSGWDRVSVLFSKARRYRVGAISGVDTPDHRSSLVQSMERFVRQAAATGEPFWYDGESRELPPQIETSLQVFLDDSLARRVLVLPLPRDPLSTARAGSSAGAIVFEQFTAAPADSRMDPRPGWVALRAAPALRNALEHRDFPLFSLWSRIRQLPGIARIRQVPFMVVSLFVCITIAAVLTCVPADFYVEVPGELQPQVRREVFAPYDGVVQQVNVDQGSRVKAGQLLVQMRQSQIELDFTRVLGEMQTAKKQLDSIQATRLQRDRSNSDTRSSEEQLTSEEEELKKLVDGLEQQRAVLSAQKAELEVRSPIDGRVLTWEVRKSLEARPVQRGQILMTVADPSGPWILELRVPDEDVGYLLKARGPDGTKLPVQFLLATDPGTQYHGDATRMAMAPRIDEDRRARVSVTASIRETLAQPRAGATVVAKVYCGKRALGFVWFHDVIEAIQKYLLF
jgi:multidrug efflux pump subunit AcrA (membrane-fusion protein)